MTERAAGALAAALVVIAALGACESPQQTPPPPTRRAAPPLDALQTGGATALQPYLDAFPLGRLGTRTDLLGATPERSMHLVQTRRGSGRLYRPNRTETLYVLRGTGICYVGEKSYPVTPGAAFKIAPGVVHSLAAAEGAVVVAVAYFEPPLVDDDDRVSVE